MGRTAGIFATVALAGCANAPAEPVDDIRPAVRIECLQRPNAPRDRPFERCKLLSVSPDTPDTRRRAEQLVERLPVSGRRPPAEDLIGAQKIWFTVRLAPDEQVSEETTGDGPDRSR